MAEFARREAIRKQKLFIVVGIATLTVAATCFLLESLFYRLSDYWHLEHFQFLVFVGPVLLGLCGVFVLLVAYLRFDPRLEVSVSEMAAMKVEQAVGTQPSPQITNPTENDDPGPTHQAAAGLKSTFGSDWNGLSAENKIDFLFHSTQQRLRSEVQALGRRSNVNLAFGVVITMFGIAVLVYLVITHQPPKELTLPSVLSHYLPRLSTVALIEAFAYFFLNLYKADLEEIKFYQNERTTSADLQIAWIAAGGAEKTKAAAFVIEQLSKRDRNVGGPDTTKKGGTTIDVAALLKMMSKVVSEDKGKEKSEE